MKSSRYYYDVFFLNIYTGLKGCGALLEGCITDLSSICGSSGNSELHGLAEEVILVEFKKKLLIKFHLNIMCFSMNAK